MTKSLPAKLSEHVIEIRYEPTSEFVDRRGEAAARLSRELSLPHWEVAENRVDVFGPDSSEKAFVSFRNCGYSCIDADPEERFADRATKFLRFLGSEQILHEPLAIHRVGVRSKFLAPFDGSFSDLMKRFLDRYAAPRPRLNEVLKSELEDIGIALELVDGVGNFKAFCGPMNSETQMRSFMNSREATYPTVAIFFDVDYRAERQQSLRMADLAQKVKGMATAGFRRFEGVSSLVLRG